MKKILYYNWCPFDDDENRGGGVTVYTRNLIKKIINDGKYECYFLYSGIDYDLSKNIKIEEYVNCFGNKCHSYRLINSPVVAPAFCNFYNINTVIQDRKILEVINKFISEKGPFDIIHFNNFEGLSLSVFDLKKYYPKTKIIFSMHNYYPLCPQVNLWKNENENCKDNHNCLDCVSCVPIKINTKDVKYLGEIAYYLRKIHISSKSKICEKTFKAIRILGKIKYNLLPIKANKNKIKDSNYKWNDLKEIKKTEKIKQNLYNCFMQEFRTKLNLDVDRILAVSDRVKTIIINRGIKEEKVFVNYIGTKFGDSQLEHGKNLYKDGIFKIIYMGYARKDKGFYFLLDALDKVKPNLSSKIDLYFAVRTEDLYVLNRLKELGNKFHGIFFKNGYHHDELDFILKDIHLGVIPVLWEDNLPQVAIEMKSKGIPVLASNLGGASELSKSKFFQFKGGDINDFNKKLEIIIENDVMKDYWEKGLKLKDMDTHVRELYKIYEN